MHLRILLIPLAATIACGDNIEIPDDHGPIAEGISAPLGEPIPSATAEQLATFERGKQVALRRFDLADGLGPAFNVTFCGGCHEKPVTGGAAGAYRNFFIAAVQIEDGPYIPANPVTFDCEAGPPPASELGAADGVIRQFYYGDNNTARPSPMVDGINVVGARNPIPFFGVGLVAELDEEELKKRIDEDDSDGDGISGRANLSGELVGRFGVKAQTVSIEAFIRGPLFNHLGVTSNPLSNEQRARLPVDGSDPDAEESAAVYELGNMLRKRAQVGAPDIPNCDLDDIPDPELASEDLFDVVSFSMLLAAPEFEPLNDQRRRGTRIFNELGCHKCHTPRLKSPRGPIPVYSDLLLHDMGEALSDGLTFGNAGPREFRTQPLWGVAATGPYLHDGRARTLDEAIRWHAGEAERAQEAYADLEDSERADLIEFLESLGGRSQRSSGLVPPNAPVPPVGEYGGPSRELSADETDQYAAGRELFDREFGHDEGLGGPRLNGDSCRACHFDPVIGGSGPRGVNVMRHGILGELGAFVPPAVGTILHKTTSLLRDRANFPQLEATIFEHRQTPHLFGLGLVDDIPDGVILANADPFDMDGDDISGKVAVVDGDRLGRFGWKAQVPSLEEFVRDAVSTELGMTLPPQDGLTYGKIHDNDDIDDPEVSLADAMSLLTFLKLLGPPPRQPAADAAAAAAGEVVFDSVGCTKCHIPSLTGSDGPVPLYSDLLLHDILPSGASGIEEFTASMREFRTAPLWGISQTAPYLHSGAADTLDQAIRAHDGEALSIRQAYEALSSDDREDLLQFLGTL